jgi:alkylhydroperoxidase family enzyme
MTDLHNAIHYDVIPTANCRAASSPLLVQQESLMNKSIPQSRTWITALSAILIGTVAMLAESESLVAQESLPRFPLLSDSDAWQRLPMASRGSGQPLPSWARMLAGEMPKAAAAFLQLDLAQRTNSPLDPGLRAAMRWVAAHANRCAYSESAAAADAARAGIDEVRILSLGRSGYPGWSNEDRAALEFARKMTVESDSVSDDEFAELVKFFGQKKAASMVLLMAYANMQDRLILSLAAPLEPNGPLAPVDVAFLPESFVTKTTPPPPLKKTPLPTPTGSDDVEDDSDWNALPYPVLQQLLETQRQKPTRLPIPAWDEVGRNLPEGLMKKPSDIIWYRIVFGYAPELAVPFEVFMRTAGAEAAGKWDRIFAGSLFWVTTRAMKCPYCMGHCEMNWEVAGLTADEIAERSRLLAGDDWSSFPPAEQHAFAFARKLTKHPWKISDADIAGLKSDFGQDRAMIVILNASRYHYMTRISNGFQLTLERENVFFDYYNVKPNSSQSSTGGTETAVPLLSTEEAWKRLPNTVSGGGGPLPNWVRAVARSLPRTAAAMLQLDYAQRSQSPLDPILRGKMRWVIAHANRSRYSEAYALADLERAGLDAESRQVLTGDPGRWPQADREPLEFARLLTVAAPTIPDEMFASLRTRFGDKRAAAMVLLAAYGNFQDRLVLGLNLPMEEQGPLAPLKVEFVEGALQIAPLMPQNESLGLASSGKTVVPADQDWSRLPYDELQARLEKQRDRKPRLPIPTWDDVKKNLPAAMASRPTRIIWNLVCSGYVPELAVPWGISTRTMWAETKPDRVFEESLFWIQTRAIECNYCMGHCEMLLEVAGLDKNAVADRTRQLAGTDWSAFPAAEQRAYAYARKLTKAPWTLTVADYRELEQDLGPDKAMATFWWLCRGLYMTRVSDGFQLPLERDNVFQSLPVPSPDPAASGTKPN